LFANAACCHFSRRKERAEEVSGRWQGKEASSGRKQPTSMLDSDNIINFTAKITMFFWELFLEPTQMLE
jgi:hypothetical protein